MLWGRRKKLEDDLAESLAHVQLALDEFGQVVEGFTTSVSSMLATFEALVYAIVEANEGSGHEDETCGPRS